MQRWVFFFLAFTSFLVRGQMKVHQGDWSPREFKGTHQGFVMVDSTSLFSIDYLNNRFRNEQKLMVNAYDRKTLDFLRNYEITPRQEEGKELDLVQIFSVQERMVLVMVEKKTGELQEKRILLQIIYPDGTRGKTIVADTLPSHQNVNEDFQVVVNKEETSFAICINYPVSLEENQKLKITTFHSDLTPKWRKIIDFPSKDKQFIFSDWRYDGDQKLYFIARHIVDLYQTESEFSSLTQNVFFLWRYDFETDQLKEIELSLNQRFIHKVMIELGQNRLILSGFFAKDKRFHNDGVFALVLDENFKATTHTIHAFSKEEQRLFNNKISSFNNRKKGVDELQAKSIQLMENGDFVLLGEEFYKEIEEPNDGRMSATNFTEIFYYQDIAVIWFGADGDVKYINVLPKKQMSVNDRGLSSSFALANDGKKLYFFFNDNPKNIPLNLSTTGELKSASSNRKVYLKEVEINEKGTVQSSVAFPPSRSAHIRPITGAQLLDGNMYFLVQKRKKNKVIRLGENGL